MSQIIDILWGKFTANVGGNPGTITSRNTFTVDTASLKVDIDVIDDIWYHIYQKSNGYHAFDNKDNIIILSTGIFIPYHFTVATDPHVLEFSWYSSAATGAIKEITPTDGKFINIFENYEMNLGPYIPYPTVNPSTSKYLIRSSFVSGDISMIGVPIELDEYDLIPIPFIKVLHNLPMKATL